MNKTIKTILHIASVAIVAAACVPGDGFAASNGARGAAAGGRSGGGAGAGPSSSGPSGGGGGSGYVLTIGDDGGDANAVALAEYPPVAGPPNRRRRPRAVVPDVLVTAHCSTRRIVDGDIRSMRVCQPNE